MEFRNFYIPNMKRLIPLVAISMLALVACEKASVSGTVIDPFSGKAVEMPTVYIKNTTFSSQKIPGGLPDGKFSFEGMKPGTYTLEAGKSKYAKGKTEFTITKEEKNLTKNVFIYSLEEKPGLYRSIEGASAERIANDWELHQPNCKGPGMIAMRTKFVEEVENPKTKKKEKKDNMLKPPKDVPVDIVALFLNKTSVTSPIEAISYPVKSESAKNYNCAVDAKESLLVPDMNAGTNLVSSYKSDNLYEIKGNLPAGRQFLVINQDGKLVRLYYLNAK